MRQEWIARGTVVPVARERRKYAPGDLRFRVKFQVIDEELAVRFIHQAYHDEPEPGVHYEGWIEGHSPSGLGLQGRIEDLPGGAPEPGDFLALHVGVQGTQPLSCVGQVQWISLAAKTRTFCMGVVVLGLDPRDHFRISARSH